MNICYKNIRIVSPSQGLDKHLDLWLKDGIINDYQAEIKQLDSETQVIAGDKLVVAPGFMDMHVHFREPGFEYKEDINSGINCAANGGFTSVCIMPNTEPTIDNCPVVEYINRKAHGSIVDVKIAASLTQNREGNHISNMLELHDSGVVMFTDDGTCILNSEVMKRVFEYAATRDLLIAQHCEDHALTQNFSANEGPVSAKLGLKGYPSVAEEIIISRDIMLSEYSGNRRYHVSHISTKGGVRIVRDAKARGLRVTCEVTPHHLTLNEELLVSYDPQLKMNPPLRSQEDINALIEGLADGTIDCIACDHAPHALHEKDVEYEKAPYGIIGLETSLGLILTNLFHTQKLSLNSIINAMSVNPRKILGLDEIKIEKGQKANLTIFAPDEEWIVDKSIFKSKARNSPFNGYKLKGKPKFTINNNMIFICEL